MKKAILKLAFFFALFLFVAAAAFSQTTTPNLGMTVPATGQTNWQVPMDANLNILDTALGGIANLPTGTTPTITAAPNWQTANVAPTAITNFIGGFPGQTIKLICGLSDTFTSLSFGTNISVISPWSCSSSSAIELVLVGTKWIEVGRTNNFFGANGVSAGTISISASTSGSHSFTTAYPSAPICLATPSGTAPPATALSYAVSSAAGSVTITLSASGTANFNWQCQPSAN